MHLIDKHTKKYPDARTPNELEAPAKGNKVFYDGDHDDAVKGFGLRVTAAGARAFILNYRVKGSERRYTIGAFPDYTVTAARSRAKQLKQGIEKGHDPIAAKQAAREAATMADLAERYIEEHLPDKRASSQGDDRSMIERDILPGLGRSTKVADVTGTNIRKLHRKVTARAPYRANRVLALLSCMFAMAIGWEMRSRIDGNPCEGLKRNPEVKRKRYLKTDELARLMKAIDGLADQQAANIVRLLLLTGARSGEVLAMRWEQLDLDAGKWTKPGATTKQKTDHEVPLSPDAVRLLSELQEASAGAGAVAVGYVFPGRDRTGHRVDLKKPWAAALQIAGITKLRIHDLRHSFASMLVSAGHGLPVIGALLGHSQVSTTARYAHLFDEVTRKATGQVGALVSAAGKRSAKVVKLRG